MVTDPDEERKLILRWKKYKDVKARDAIVKSHLRFVVKVARSRTKDPERLQDLIAAGNIGLLTALDRYDVNREVRFLTYAGWWIAEAIYKEDYADTLVHVPTHRQKAQRKRAKAYAKALAMHGPEGVINIDPGAPEAATVALDILRETPEEEHAHTPIGVDTNRTNQLLREEIAKLPPREQTVLNCYFGIKDTSRNLVQIAALLGMSPERIRQIKICAVKMLRDRLSESHAVNSAADVY